jgi:hypothetical protein
MQQPGKPLVQRNDAASRKDQHRYHKSPDVQLLTVTEGMRVIRSPLAPMKAMQQQRAISSTDNRVDTLRKHRGAFIKKRGGEFRGGDDQIGAHGYEN